MIKRTYNKYEQHTYGVANFMAATTFFIIAGLAGGIYLLFKTQNWLPGLKEMKDGFTFEAFTLFGKDNAIASLTIVITILFLVASMIQIFWTKRIERITKRHSVPLILLFQLLIGVAVGLMMLILKAPYILALPSVAGMQCIFRGVIGLNTIDQRGYKPYLIFETLFVILALGGVIAFFILGWWITLPWLITVIVAALFNIVFNAYKYSQIIQEPEWQMLSIHTKKYKLLVELWLGFRLSSDWNSTILNRIYFNKRHR